MRAESCVGPSATIGWKAIAIVSSEDLIRSHHFRPGAESIRENKSRPQLSPIDISYRNDLKWRGPARLAAEAKSRFSDQELRKEASMLRRPGVTSAEVCPGS